MSLFHTDNDSFFDYPRLRAAASVEVRESALIQRCSTGDLEAAKALKRGFWAFVWRFEKAIDERLSMRLPREPLYERFGRNTTRRNLADTARGLKTLQKSELEAVFQEALGALKEMRHEEWTHAQHWAKDAENLGINRDELDKIPVLPAIQALIDSAYAENLVEFFAKSLTATEFIAEELGEVLAQNPAYKNLFRRKRAVWMEVHTIPHEDFGVSHADIVLDFARAYSEDNSAKAIEDLAIEGMRLFGAAAAEVENYFCRSTLEAAE